jgi:hypothetical protein
MNNCKPRSSCEANDNERHKGIQESTFTRGLLITEEYKKEKNKGRHCDDRSRDPLAIPHTGLESGFPVLSLFLIGSKTRQLGYRHIVNSSGIREDKPKEEYYMCKPRRRGCVKRV